MSTTTMSASEPAVIAMTDEQRFFFDLKGWLLLPGVLGEAECAAAREHLLAGGSPFTGPAQELLDHPAITPVLHELLSDRKPHDEAWQFRCESSGPSIRQAGFEPGSTKIPHVVLPPQKGGPMIYQYRNGRMYAGLVRVVWELTPVRRGKGGTLFLSGTHKAEYPFPESVREVDNRHLESYECPAGSAFIFTESLLHASTAWTDAENPRVSIFSAYNSVWAQWHRLNLDPAIIASMPRKRQSLFRGVYAIDFRKDQPTSGHNLHYSTANSAL
jgi:hypothetical protein